MLVSMDGREASYATLEEFVSISAVKQKMKEAGMEGSFDELLIQYQAGDKRAGENI